MITPEQQLIIETLLDQDNIHDFMETMILEYASDVKRTSELLSLIPKLAEKQLQIKEGRIIEYSNAVNFLIAERSTQKKNYTKSNQSSKFSTLMYVSKAHFPNGHCTGGSTKLDKFFTEFVSAIINKVGFDYESVDDWYWICTVAQCREWMIQVIKQNIDENFKEPIIKKRGC